MNSKVMVARMDDVLKPLGFTRRNGTWNRKLIPYVDVVDIQISKAGERMTINAGVFHAGVHAKCWNNELPNVIQEPECIVRARIGELGDGRDLWWDVNDRAAVEDISYKLKEVVLPFLNRMHSFDAMEEFLVNARVTKGRYPPPIIYLAVIKDELGKSHEASSILTELRDKTSEAWKPRIDEVKERLAC